MSRFPWRLTRHAIAPRLLAGGVLAGALGCMNDAPVATSAATAGLVFSANVLGTAAGRTIEIAVMYHRAAGEAVRVPAQPGRVTLEPGTTVQQAVTVDLAGCLKDGDRLPKNTPGCQLTVELRLLDEGGNTVDVQTKDAPGAPTAPGQVVELGNVTVGIQVGSVEVNPGSARLNVTQTQQLAAVVRDTRGATLANASVSWVSSDPSVVQLSRATGANVTVSALKLGAATITASSSGKTSPPIPVTVAAPDPLVISPASASVEAGATLQLTVASPPGPITWQSSDPTIASVDQNGLVRGVQARENNPVTITATSGTGPTQRSGTARVTVTVAPPLAISQQPGAGCVIVGQTVTLRIASPPAAVTWATDNTAVATVNPNSGVVTGQSAGQATIRATSANRSGTASVCVVGPLGNVPATLAITAGQTAQVSPSGATGATVSYTSDNTNVATVSASGLVTAVGLGQAKIATTLTAASGSQSVTTTVTVNAASVTIAPTPVSVTIGGKQSLTATARDASGKAITGGTFAWTVDDPSVVRLSATSGNLVEVEGLKLGTTSVKASAGGATGTVQVTVTRGAPASITVTLGTSSLTISQTTTATAEVKDAAGNVLTDQTVTWTAGNTGVATVASTGARTGTVTAVGSGSADITASIGSVSGKATVQVSEKPVATLTISPTSATIAVGGSGQVLTAVPKDAQGITLVGRAVTWRVTAGDTSLVRLSAQSSVSTATGATVTVTGVTVGGPVAVTATSGDKTATAQITVTPGAPASISVTPTTLNLTAGQSARATAVVKDAQGSTITTLPNGLVLSWQSGNTGVATVVPTTGQPFQADVGAFGQGSTNVTARLTLSTGPITSNPIAVTVNPLPPANIVKISGDNSTCPVNTFDCSFTVKVTNANNQPVAGVQVDWAWPLIGCGPVDAVVTTTTDAQGQTTLQNCKYPNPGVYQQMATVKGTAISTTFTYTESGLVLTYKGVVGGVPEAGKSTTSYDVTAVGVVASGLSVVVQPQVNQPSITVTSATFTPTTTTPTSLKIVLCTCGLPTGTSGVLDVTVSSTTSGVAPVKAALNWSIAAASVITTGTTEPVIQPALTGARSRTAGTGVPPKP